MRWSDRIEAEAADWLVRKDRNDWSRGDQAALDAWLDESTAHRVAYLRLDHVWGRIDDLVEVDRPPPRMETRRFGQPRWLTSIAASALAVAAGIGWLARQPASVVHSTGIGQHQEVRLADNSNIALNTRTRMIAVVDKSLREVWLDHGEAYFEIAHDPRHPFVVHAGKQVITVLGTKFLVREDGGALRVAVTEGRVRISPATGGEDRPIVLTRGEVATATDDGLLVATEGANALRDDVAWRRGTLVFDRVTLAEAVSEFNRYTDRQIVIDDPAVAAIRVGGRFSTANVDGFANLLHASLGLRVTTGGEVIRISG